MTPNDLSQKRCYFFPRNISVAWPTKMTDSENVKETSIFIFRLCCSPLDPENNESCPHKQILLYRLEFISIWNGSKVPNKICLDSVCTICSPKLKSRILHASLINKECSFPYTYRKPDIGFLPTRWFWILELSIFLCLKFRFMRFNSLNFSFIQVIYVKVYMK